MASPGAVARRPAPAPRHNLPAQVSRFFGREDEIAQLKDRLAEQRLVTLTGSGGVGKTRLALRVAEEVVGDFAGGVWFVALAPLSDPGLVPQQVAADLGLTDDPSRPAMEAVKFFLRDHHTLLVLDNCEHLLEACARLADVLLQACPRLRLLASSREPFGIAGEAVFVVPSLPFPDPDHPPVIERLNDYAALSLFVDRARLVRPDYLVTPENAASLTRICRRLDGIPLALELAAARMRLLNTETLAARLDDAFGLLTGGSRTALPRHQTLRATIDWSYQLLSEEERQLLQRLSIFAGGCTLPAVEAVCSGEGLEAGQAILSPVVGDEIVDRLAALVDKSMVIVSREPGEEARYRLLEMVRQYAREKLQEGGAGERLNQRHYEYFLKFAESNGPHLWYKDRPAWIRKFVADHENLRLALEWSYNNSTDDEAGPRLTVALQPFWNQRDFRETSKWFGIGLDRWRSGAAITPSLSARLLTNYLGDVHIGGFSSIGPARRQSLAISRSLGPEAKEILIESMWNSMWSSRDRPEYWDQVQALMDEREAIIQNLGPGSALDTRLYRALHAYQRGTFELARGQFKLAKASALESIRWFEECCHDVNLIWPYELLGELAIQTGDYGEAHKYYAEALRLAIENGDTRQGNNLACLCKIAMLQGDHAQALDYCKDYIKLAYEKETPFNVLERLEMVAKIFAKEGRYDEAARLSGAAEALTEKYGRKISAESSEVADPGDWTTRYADASLDALVPDWRTRPDGEAILQAWQDGRALSYDEVVAEALAEI